MRQVVATVTLVGLGPGVPVWADDADPQVARWLRGGQLRAIDPDPRPEVEDSADGGQTLDQAQAADPQPEVEPVPVTPRRPRAKKP